MTEITFLDGPRHGATDTMDDPLPVTIGDGSDGGVYQRTDDDRDGRRLYRWQPITHSEAEAIVRGDLRANQR